MIGIEGVPTAGKSSLCTEIGTEYEICPEFAQYAGTMPSYPTNHSEIRSQCDHALTCEKNRRNDYNLTSQPLLIMDSSPLATLGYIYVTSTILNSNILEEFLQEYIERADRDEIFEPDAIVWLRPTHSTVTDRWEQRGTDEFWTNPLVIKALNKMYEQICELLPSVVIDSTITEISEETEITRQLISDLDKKTQIYKIIYENRENVFNSPQELYGQERLLKSQRTEWPLNS